MKDKAIGCEVERLLAVVGGKWKVLLLRQMFDGPRRHGELRRALPGISQKVLTAQLRELELDGALVRAELAGLGKAVEYALTDFGRELQALILAMHTLATRRCDVLKRRPELTRHRRSSV